jgi:hypothetical protein
MASARATTLAQGFAQRVFIEMYDTSLTNVIVNRDFEGEINQVGSVLNILSIARISERVYTGADMTSPDGLLESNAKLTIDQWKSFYWIEKTIDNWQSYIKNPHSTVVAQAALERNMNMDKFVLGLYGDVGSGGRVGTDYTTGTVTVDVTTGAVTGSGTTFTSGMVGKGFKATGHTRQYRIKSYASATSIVIEDDYDDLTSAYTGGAIAGGTAYVVEAATAIAITPSNLLAQVGQLKLKLDKAQANGFNSVPADGRFLIVPPEFEDVATRASGIVLHVPEVYEQLVKVGLLTMLKGFKVYVSNSLTGDNTNGYHIIGGHTSWCTFAEKLLQATIEEEVKANFGSAYKDLFVYGAKVADSRRHMAVELFATFSG